MMYVSAKEKAGLVAPVTYRSPKKNSSSLIPEISTSPEILLISSYPPRECGIATYTQDLIQAINEKFDTSLAIKICALENTTTSY